MRKREDGYYVDATSDFVYNKYEDPVTKDITFSRVFFYRKDKPAIPKAPPPPSWQPVLPRWVPLARLIPQHPLNRRSFGQIYLMQYGWTGGPLRDGSLDRPVKHADLKFGKYRLGIGASLSTPAGIGFISFIRSTEVSVVATDKQILKHRMTLFVYRKMLSKLPVHNYKYDPVSIIRPAEVFQLPHLSHPPYECVSLCA